MLIRPLRSVHELWLPDHHTLVLRSGLRHASQRVALAHGVGHAALGHADDRPKHEKQADQFAARNLIDPDELADLHRWCPDEGRLIQELGVTRRILRAYLAE
ncbi:ImmA/IrrE family metallo-endopeptidase [Microbacterium sp. ZXX196]|uniref:ImmA/IrrE family metallo-endopeptidase n=1 Tax=Microbacterium sp. ZXX196 TaxID=2609291 RepID=UPI0018ACB3AC